MDLWEVEDYGTRADRACWALFALTTCIVILRLTCRARSRYGEYGGLGLDDYITILCTALLLVTCVLVSIGSHYGLGRHMRTLEPPEIVHALKWNVIISSVLIWSFSMPKFAIVAILKRILNHGLKTTILFWGLALSSQICILATSIWWWKQCTPVSYGWDRSIPGGSCAPISIMANLGYFTSAYSAFLDIFFALYPIPFIMRLNMPLKSRIAVSIALGLSALAFIVSVYKLAIFGSVFEKLAEDPTYPVPFLDILGVLEGCILLICASLPTLGPLVRLVKAKLDISNHSRNSNKSGSSAPTTSGNSWANIKGHKLEDPELGSTGMHSSVDDILLVSTTRSIPARKS